MATLDDFRKLPQYRDASDTDIINGVSQKYGIDPSEIASEFGIQRNDPGFVSTVKRSGAQFAGGVGELYGDATGNRNNALSNWAEDVEFRNPSGVNSLQDIADNPGLAVREAVGNAATFLVPGGALKLGAGALRGAKALNAARMVDNPLTQAAVAGVPSLSEIGDMQRSSGQGENFGLKVGSALGVGAIENLGGVQRMMGLGGQQTKRTVAQEVADFGAGPWRTAGKTMLRSGVEEGLEEIPQTFLEKNAGYQNPFSEQNLNEAAFGAAMGAIGGGVMGAGHGAARGLRHAQIKRDISTDLLNIDQPFERQQNLGQYEREFQNKAGQDGGSWYNNFVNQQLDQRNAQAEQTAYDNYQNMLGADARAEREYQAGLKRDSMGVPLNTTSYSDPVRRQDVPSEPLPELGALGNQNTARDSMGVPLGVASTSGPVTFRSNANYPAGQPITGSLGNNQTVATTPQPKRPKGAASLAFETKLDKAIADGHIDGNHQIVHDWIASNKYAADAKIFNAALDDHIGGPNVVNETSEAKLARQHAEAQADKTRTFTDRGDFTEWGLRKSGATDVDVEAYMRWKNLGSFTQDAPVSFDSLTQLYPIQTKGNGKGKPPSHATVRTRLTALDKKLTALESKHLTRDVEATVAVPTEEVTPGAVVAPEEAETGLTEVEREDEENAADPTDEAATDGYDNADVTGDVKAAVGAGVTQRAADSWNRLKAHQLGLEKPEDIGMADFKYLSDDVKKQWSDTVGTAHEATPVAEGRMTSHAYVVHQFNALSTAIDEAAKEKEQAAQLAAAEKKEGRTKQKLQEKDTSGEDAAALEKGVESLLSGDTSVAIGLMEILGGKNGLRLMQWLRTHYGMPASVNTPKAAVEYFVGKQAESKAEALSKADQMADLWGEGFDKLTDDQKIDFAKSADGLGDLVHTPAILRQLKEEINGTNEARQSTPESARGTESSPAEEQRPDTAGAGESGAAQARTPEVKVRKKRTLVREVAYESQGEPNPKLEAPVGFFNAAFDRLAQTPVFSYLSSMVDRFVLTEDPAPKMSFDSSDGTWRVTTGFLSDPELMGGGRSHVLDFYMHHELGHAVDGSGGTDRFSSRKELNLNAHMDAKGVLHVVPASPAAKEMVSLWDRFKGKNSIGDELTYVFGQAGGVVSQANAYGDTSAAKVTSIAKSELFAHMFAFYNHAHVWASLGGKTSKEFLRAEAPAAFHFMESVQNEIEKDITRAAQFKARTEVNERGSERETEKNTGNNAGGRLGIAPQEYEALGLSREVAPSVTQAYDRIGNSQLGIDAANLAKRAFKSFMSLHDLVNEYGRILTSAKPWHDSVLATIATRKQLEADAESIAARAGKKGINLTKLNEFIAKSTKDQKWGYDAEFEKTDGTKRSVVADPEMAREFKKLSPTEQQIVKDIFAHGEKMKTNKFKILKDLGLSGEFNQTGSLDGPYAPLKRFGDYVGVAKSKELMAAEEAEDVKKIAELKADEKHYMVSNFDTLAMAKDFEKQMAADGWHFTDSFAKSVKVNEGRPMKPEILQKVLSAIKAEKLPAGVATTITNTINDLYMSAFDEHNARTSGLKRKNYGGFDKDMIRSFLSHARAEAGFLANIKHGGATNDAFYAMQQEAKDAVTKKRIGQDVFNMIASHYAANLEQKATPIQDRAMALTSVMQLATNPAYHIQNLMQPLMTTVPRMAADFGDYAGAWKHLVAAYATAGKVGVRNIDLSKVQNPKLREMLQTASDAGLLDVGMDEDLQQFEATHTGYAAVDKSSNVAKSIVHKLRQVSRMVEATNRISAGTAAYNMAIEKGKTHEQAQQYALNVLRDTQGDFSRTDSPLILKKLPKVVGQYRKFQLMMMAHYVKAFRDAFLSDDPKVQAVGRRALAYSLFHAFASAGVLGMPLMNLVGLLVSKMGGDDEPEDLERWMRENLGDGLMADMLIHGPLMFAGLDAKLSQDKVFSILPYSDWDLTSKKGVTNLVTGAMGPSFGNAAKMADGLGALKDGDYQQGLEKFLPSGLSNAMKAFRVANDGYTLKNGDLMVKPEDINGFAMAMDAVGLKGPEMRKMDWYKGQQYEIKQFYSDRTKEIEQDYAEAVKSGDTDEMGKARDEWQALQDGKDRLRLYFNDSRDELKRQPLSNLLKYPQTQAKREAKLQKAYPLTSK